MLCDPLAASAPLQSPAAVHAAALAEFHVSVEDPPAATAPGLAVSCTVGNGFTVTATLAGWLVPPAPLQVIVKLAFADNAPLLCEPLVASVPLQSPAAVHALALAEFQVSVEAPPAATAPGLAVSCTVGNGFTETLKLAGWLVPPAPLQVTVKLAFADNALVLCEPLAASAPLHAPDAAHAVAPVDAQVN
jgi:hypothetical protein